ncbi:MAG TPA: STAS domain-containing protein [Miltoncostaea sp.]|nr:STAS domain-containing protein [Miltoncostaea sp.]
MLPRIEITRADMDGMTWLALEGELDLAGADEVGSRLIDACEGVRHAVIDTRRLRFVDLAGLRLLVELGERIHRRGAELSVIAGPRVRRLADLTDLGDRLDLDATPEELLGLTGPPPVTAGELVRTEALCAQVAAEVTRQQHLVERMQSLSQSATSLLIAMRNSSRVSGENRARRAASR